MPEGVKWAKPEGGLFLWARTPDSIDTEELLESALESKVAYVPGFTFYPKPGGGRHTMRLNFSCTSEEKINEGIYRLSLAIKKMIK